jgi:hypothetical protein
MGSNVKKSATLGLPHGTAVHRLRKSILFHLLKKLGENVCFKCSGIIDKIEELSIEHKKPWEGVSAELFWDLDNIAFSHLYCNRPHRLDGRKKIGPEGTVWCSGCKAFLSSDLFWKCPSRLTGFRCYCVSCKKRYDTRINHAKKA